MTKHCAGRTDPQFQIPYGVRISLRNEGRKRIFSDRGKLREFVDNRSNLKEWQKYFFQAETK